MKIAEWLFEKFFKDIVKYFLLEWTVNILTWYIIEIQQKKTIHIASAFSISMNDELCAMIENAIRATVKMIESEKGNSE